MGIFDWLSGKKREKTESTQTESTSIDSLIVALKDKDEKVRKSAAIALGKVGLPAVAALIAALRQEFSNMSPRILYDQAGAINEWDRVRGAIKAALVEIGTPAVQPLVAALKDEMWGVRMQAAFALGDIGDAQAVESLKAALNDEQEFVRMAAKMALEKIVPTS